MLAPSTSSSLVDQLRPSRRLLAYYALLSVLLGPFFWALLIPLWIRFRTLRYTFDEEGASMIWGRLFRREVHLGYARIQDIHLVSNALERWLGLARIRIQTASASAKAEMTIVGILDYEQLRDDLYVSMNRAQEGSHPADSKQTHENDALLVELTATLRQVGEELRAVRRAFETRVVEQGDA